ncbi:MAG TPA: hypothetical protein VMV95_01640 [Bacillota bacterium]|nr:hypothetical protein [Bacillota bacterium]
MKKSLIFLIIGIVIILGVVGYFYFGGGGEEGTVEVEYKGVWMPALGASTLFPENYFPEDMLPEGYNMSIMEPVFADFDKAEQAGINTFAFQIGYWVDENGEISILPGTKEFFADFIERAHARGFKIWLNPEILHRVDSGGPSEMRIIPEEWIENTDLLENYELAIIETAKFAEEYDVEIFSPSSEMYVNFDFEKPGREISKKLLIDIKPEIDAVYSGKICLRGEWPNDDFLSYYSCFGVPVNMVKNEEEKQKLIEHMEFQMNREEEIELMVGELYEGHDWQSMSPEEKKRGFETSLEIVEGKVSGIFILDTGRLTQLFPESFEDTIKEFYEWFG